MSGSDDVARRLQRPAPPGIAGTGLVRWFRRKFTPGHGAPIEQAGNSVAPWASSATKWITEKLRSAKSGYAGQLRVVGVNLGDYRYPTKAYVKGRETQTPFLPSFSADTEPPAECETCDALRDRPPP